MKKLSIYLLATTFLAACGGGEKTLEDLKSERKDLISAFNNAEIEHKTKLDSLNVLIAVLDTTERKIKTTPVTIDTVRQIQFEHFFEVHGNVEVEENAALYAEAPGTVKKIHVREGQSVKKGDLIISLESSTIESSIKEVQNGLDLATTVFEKQNTLWNQKIGSEMDYLQAKNNKESLEQKLKTLNAQLDMYRIKAPFNGVVDQIVPRVGEAAAPGFPVARVLNLDKIYLEAAVSEAYMNTVKAGGYVEVKFPSLNETIKAKVTRTGNFINPANRTFTVRVEFSNPNGKYKPNQLAIIKIRDYVAADALVLPSKIIQQDRQGNSYIYTFEQVGKVKRVKKLDLVVGQSYEGVSMILDGVEANQVFIDKGSKNVQVKDAVEIKK